MNANPKKSLRKIGIEFDYLVTNPALREMFTRTEAGNDPRLRGLRWDYQLRPGARDEKCGVDLTGSPDALSNFFDKHLKDEDPHAYSLEYL